MEQSCAPPAVAPESEVRLSGSRTPQSGRGPQRGLQGRCAQRVTPYLDGEREAATLIALLPLLNGCSFNEIPKVGLAQDANWNAFQNEAFCLPML